MNFEITVNVTNQDLDEILGWAYDTGGVSYWCGEYEDNGNYSHTLYDYHSDTYWSFNKEDLVRGIESYILNSENGFRILCTKNGNCVIDQWQLDADVADQIVQYACMGTVRYG